MAVEFVTVLEVGKYILNGHVAPASKDVHLELVGKRNEEGHVEIVESGGSAFHTWVAPTIVVDPGELRTLFSRYLREGGEKELIDIIEAPVVVSAEPVKVEVVVPEVIEEKKVAAKKPAAKKKAPPKK